MGLLNEYRAQLVVKLGTLNARKTDLQSQIVDLNKELLAAQADLNELVAYLNTKSDQ